MGTLNTAASLLPRQTALPTWGPTPHHSEHRLRLRYCFTPPALGFHAHCAPSPPLLPSLQPLPDTHHFLVPSLTQSRRWRKSVASWSSSVTVLVERPVCSSSSPRAPSLRSTSRPSSRTTSPPTS